MTVNITKEMTMGELLSIDGGVAVVLMNAGMHCIGCPSSIGESLEEACMVHGIEVDELLKNINEYFANK
jgi:hybrid cluster-associated redox disulfide protein